MNLMMNSKNILFLGLHALEYHIHFTRHNFNNPAKKCTGMIDHVVPVSIFEFVWDTIFCKTWSFEISSMLFFQIHFVVGVSEPNIHSIFLFVHFVEPISLQNALSNHGNSERDIRVVLVQTEQTLKEPHWKNHGHPPSTAPFKIIELLTMCDQHVVRNACLFQRRCQPITSQIRKSLFWAAHHISLFSLIHRYTFRSSRLIDALFDHVSSIQIRIVS